MFLLPVKMAETENDLLGEVHLLPYGGFRRRSDRPSFGDEVISNDTKHSGRGRGFDIRLVRVSIVTFSVS